MKTFHFKFAAALYLLLVGSVHAEASKLSLSTGLKNGNQLSKIEKFNGVNYNIHIDGKFSVDDQSKFTESTVSVVILSHEREDWKNSLKSKFQVHLSKPKLEITLTGSQSNFIKYDGWSVVAMHTTKYHETTKSHVISFWIILIRGELNGPEEIRNFITFPEKEGNKILEINGNKSLAVFLGNAAIE